MRNLSVPSFLLFFPIMLLTSGDEVGAQVALDGHEGTKAEVEHVLGAQQEEKIKWRTKRLSMQTSGSSGTEPTSFARREPIMGGFRSRRSDSETTLGPS